MTEQATLSRSDLQKMSGASPSTISRALKNGRIRGAFRHDGLHWLIPMTPSVTDWCKDQKRSQQLRVMPKARLNRGLGKGTAIITIEGLNQGFTTWQRKMGNKIEQYTITELDKVILLLEPFEELLQSLRTLREKKTARILR